MPLKTKGELGFKFLLLIKKMRLKHFTSKKLSLLLLGFVTALGLSAQITPHEAIKQMTKGINLGNTFEPPNEGEWGNPKTEEFHFDMYKDAGFDCVRIPVRWDNHTGKTAPFKINETWMNRIEQVVDWGLERDMFIVINTHHDDWIKSDYSSNK